VTRAITQIRLALGAVRSACSKPQYLWQPGRAVRRALLPVAHGEIDVELPWGLKITVDSEEPVGRAIVNQGIYDPIVTEALWRLAGPKEIALDIGANIGYTASILSYRLGLDGQVHAFEPHPRAARLLRRNANRWARDNRCSPINIHGYALSDESGVADMESPDGQVYSGARLVGAAGDFAVRKCRLDDCFPDEMRVGVAKIDVEGHEWQVLAGMRRFLEARLIRDIVFEEAAAFPAPTHGLLGGLGYTIFAFREELMGLRVVEPRKARRKRGYDPPSSYVATVEPERALKRLQPRWWRSFGVARRLVPQI
jgi:FkbM family methyltransferase